MNELLSECCDAPKLGETDLCSACKEHAEFYMEEENSLMVVNVKAIPAIKFSPDTMKLDKLKKDYPASKIPTDLTIPKNYKFVAEGKKAHQKARTLIEKTHKELKKPAREVGLQLDKAKTLMLGDLKPIEDAWKKAKQDFDDIEKKRIEAEEKAKQKAKQEAMDKVITKIAWLNAYSSRLVGKSSEDIMEAIEALKAEKFEWAGELVESAKNTVNSVTVQLEKLHGIQVENETAKKLAEEERVKREAESKKLAKERAEMEAEKAKLQAEKDELQAAKDKVEREKQNAENELNRLKAEKAEAALKKEQDAIEEKERIEAEKAELARVAEQEKQAKKEKAKALKAEKALVKKLAEELESRQKETLDALVEILRQDKPVAVLASEVLGRVQDGSFPNLTFK